MTTSLETTEAWLQRLKRTSSGLRRTCQDIRIQVIKELGEKEHILALEIKRKLEQNQELSESERAYIERPTRGKHSDYKLSKTHHGCLNAAAISKLDEYSDKAPFIMFRTSTLLGNRPTNGFTTQDLFVPSAHLMRDLPSREGRDETYWIRTNMVDIPLQELRVMLGHHLLWRDRIQDELLSYTVSYPFAVVHLYLRHLKGQEIGSIAMINRMRALQPEEWYTEEMWPQTYKPAKFYAATDLCDYTGVYFDHEWQCQRDLPGLHPRKTNHEFITHGPVKYPQDDRLKQAAWADLVSAGLFKLVPELKVDENSRAAGLYTVLRYIRTSNYNHVRTTTEEELEIAQKIAWLHTRVQPGKEQEKSRPNLWILLHALTFRKRAAGDLLFRGLIRRLGYTRQDLDENLHATFGECPANLPELHSLYHLAVDVRVVVGGQPLNALVLTSTYTKMSLPEDFKDNDAAYDKLCTPKLTEGSNDGYEIKGKCSDPCRCSRWGPTYKRKRAKEAVQLEQSDNADEPLNDQAEASSQTKRSKFESSAFWEEHEEHAEVEHQIHHLDEHQSHHLSGYLQDLFETEPAESLELNTMLLTYKYVGKTNY
ncbi:hypothetical protein KCU95_g13085, partial [Aureobasidium melanogenum]